MKLYKLIAYYKAPKINFLILTKSYFFYFHIVLSFYLKFAIKKAQYNIELLKNIYLSNEYSWYHKEYK